MTPEEKIQYVKDIIDEETTISPKGQIWYRLYRVGHPDNPDEYTLLTIGEQKRIILKLQEDGFIKNVQESEDRSGYWLEKVQEGKPSNLLGRRYSYIKTVDDLLQQKEVFHKFLSILGDLRELKSNHSYKILTDEKNDALIQLLIDLKLIRYDWDELKKQTHREVGNRIIEFYVDADDIFSVLSRVNGKNGKIQKEAIELISKEIGERFTLSKIVRIFVDAGVPETMFIEETKWRAVFYVLSYYATSPNTGDYDKLLKIILKVTHPLFFGGDEAKSEDVKKKYNLWLRYDGVQLNNGTIYYAHEDEAMGKMWFDIDGKELEPESYLIIQKDVAKLWVIWSQIIILVSSYKNNHDLDKKTLEDLYLELIAKAEELIEKKTIGELSEMYKRPFTSLSTSEIETESQNSGGSLGVLNAFLLKIASLNPHPHDIAKELEENTKLIKRIATVTRAIDGGKIDLKNISYEQALFLAKIIVGHLYNILEVFSTGYVSMTDENLNAQYILLMDNLQGILQRDDFVTIRENFPNDLPKHLFEMVGDMDVWWEHGGKQSLTNLVGDVGSSWVRAGMQTFPLPQWLMGGFSAIETSISHHKKLKNEAWKKLQTQLPKYNEIMTPKQQTNPLDADTVKIELKNAVLTINKSNGNVQLNSLDADFNPKGREFKVLLRLATSPDKVATYKELIDGDVTSTSKRNLTFTIRNIKESLGILPREQRKNEDIFRNMKDHGYKLIG